MSVNKAMIVGNLGRDPEVNTTQGGRTVARLNVATTRRWTNDDGEVIEETEWHRVTVWGKPAEACGKYLSKGRQVYVEGRLRTSSYEGDDGVKKYSTEIIAENVQFLGGKDENKKEKSDDEGGGRGGRSSSRSSREPAPQDDEDDDW